MLEHTTHSRYVREGTRETEQRAPRVQGNRAEQYAAERATSYDNLQSWLVRVFWNIEKRHLGNGVAISAAQLPSVRGLISFHVFSSGADPDPRRRGLPPFNSRRLFGLPLKEIKDTSSAFRTTTLCGLLPYVWVYFLPLSRKRECGQGNAVCCVGVMTSGFVEAGG